MEHLIDWKIVLAMQNLAFQGTNKELCCAGNGNLFIYLEYLSLFDPLLNGRLRKVDSKEMMARCVGKKFRTKLN